MKHPVTNQLVDGGFRESVPVNENEPIWASPNFDSTKETEAEWIHKIRNYCRENKVLPTHLIEAHKELNK